MSRAGMRRRKQWASLSSLLDLLGFVVGLIGLVEALALIILGVVGLVLGERTRCRQGVISTLTNAREAFRRERPLFRLATELVTSLDPRPLDCPRHYDCPWRRDVGRQPG
jgi:hypothetical protein